MSLQTASRPRFGPRCFFAGAVLLLACLDTLACSESSEPKSAPVDGGSSAADAAEQLEGGSAQDGPAPPARIEAGRPSPEATAPTTDGEAGDASDAADGARPGALGAACSDSTGCQSGHCSESVCCDTECDLRSEACNRQGSEGTCTFAPVLHVDPNAGDDSSKGLESAPLRTVSFAVRVASSVTSVAAPWTIVLHDGTYSAGTGERWPLLVQAPMKIEALHAGKAVLLGDLIPGDGLVLEGNISLTGVVLKNFYRAALAFGGPLRIERVEVDGPIGFAFTNGVVVTLENSNFRNLTGIGVELMDRARLTMTGGSVTADPNAVGCEKAIGIQASADARLELDGVFVGGFATSGLVASMANVNVVASTFNGNGLPACDGAQIKMLDRAVPTFQGVEVLNGKAVGIDVSGNSGTLDVSVTDSVLTNNYLGIALHGIRRLTMRGSRITDSFVGIYAPTANDPVLVHLGEPGAPGNNVIRGSNRSLVLLGKYDPMPLMHVDGNQWNPGVEGADAEGRYTLANTLVSPQQPVGGNFFAPKVMLDI